MQTAYRVTLSPAQCAVDLGDGSERGLYVGQDYILRALGRPHRAINLMYCYYPLDKEWPARISEVCKSADTNNAWGYPYDDYFPFVGETPFRQMRDIRRHGQDVILTLTCDPNVTDEMITGICEKLRPFGRLMLRLNHECTGTWFTYNKRCTYQQVADFFVRFAGILKKTAPNVQIILCAGAVLEPTDTEVEYEKEFTEAFQTADIWAIDQYTSLNWGWPAEVAERDNRNHKTCSVSDTFAQVERSYQRYVFIDNGRRKPVQVCEFNDDGDVLGPVAQARRVKEYYNIIKERGKGWFSGLTMYQFRDDGRLGLEVTDPNDPTVGIPQPLLAAYRDIISDPYFSPVLTIGEAVTGAMDTRWGGAEDAEGVAMLLDFEKDPVFCEAVFGDADKDLSMMLSIRGKWFYKAPGVTRVDLLPAFWEAPLSGAETLPLYIFVTPSTGENEDTGAADWDTNVRTLLPELPSMRIRFQGAMDEIL